MIISLHFFGLRFMLLFAAQLDKVLNRPACRVEGASKGTPSEIEERPCSYLRNFSSCEKKA